MTSTMVTPSRRTATRFTSLKRAFVVVLIAVLVGAWLAARDDGSRFEPATVADGDISHMIVADGQLYWTGNSTSVYRVSPAKPGDELLLYRERDEAYESFGELAYAAGHVYFVANDHGVSRIKRVSAAGGKRESLADQDRRAPQGRAQMLGRSPAYIGQRDLDTDGSHLYWADASGLRRMPLVGGTIETLARGSGYGQVGHDKTHVYYSAGRTVRRVAKTGGPATTVVYASATVTALAVRGHRGRTEVLSGDAGGTVRSDDIPASGVTSTQYQVAKGGPVTGLAFDGRFAVWSTELTVIGGRTGAGLVSDNAADVGIDGDAVYWQNGTRILRY